MRYQIEDLREIGRTTWEIYKEALMSFAANYLTEQIKPIRQDLEDHFRTEIDDLKASNAMLQARINALEKELFK